MARSVAMRPRNGLSVTAYKPLLRAFALGYLSTVSPRIIKIALSLLRTGQGKDVALSDLFRVLSGALALNRFPTFCGVFVGGSTLLRPAIEQLLVRTHAVRQHSPGASSALRRRILASFLSSFVAAWFSLKLLNTRRNIQPREEKRTGHEAVSIGSGNRPSSKIIEAAAVHSKADQVAGKTVDLTLFAATRAVDVIIGDLWSRRRSRRRATNKWTRVEGMISHLTDAGVFAASAGLVMWAWLYAPNQLPKAYNKWIREAAAVDDRLAEALRRIRSGKFVYGKETGQADLLQSMCADYGWPLSWGDPTKSIPIPCEVVHMGKGPSCEYHALSRFTRAFKFALAMYLPLNLVMRARSPSWTALRVALMDALRSSAFLASFISIFYYSICLCRTRLGPRIFSYRLVTPQMWDGGLDTGAACAMCGWSILVEAERRRHEIAFFVAPRAAAVLLPRSYDRKYMWREKLAFSTSAAIILTYAQHKPERVRGVFGRLLGAVIGAT